MSRKNGGIIGPANTPVGGLFKGVAGGVWRMNDVLNYVGNSQWPSTPKSIDNSLRFNSGSSDYLTVANPTAGNRKTGTLSFWIKICKLSTHYIYNTYNSGASGFSSSYIQLTSAGRIEFINYQASGGNHSQVSTNRLFRDFSAWYHFVIAWDTTQSTASDRVKIYVNGTQETSLSNTDYPGSNEDLFFDIGGTSNPRLINYAFSNYGDNYLAEMVYVNGTALDPTSFGETDSTTGIWKPKKIGAIANAGDNSFYLDFKDSSSLGKDQSGLGNNFTVNNLTSVDQAVDTCVENFCILNSNMKSTSNVELSQGNLRAYLNQSTGWQHAAATFAVKSGKWYWEAKATTVSASDKTSIGVFQFDTTDVDFVNNTNTDRSSKGLSGHGAGTGSYTYAQGDIIMCAMDIDNNKIYWGKNGTFFGTLDPANGTGSTTQTVDNSNFCVPAVGGYGGSVWELNFGVPQFTVSSGNSDANGHGNFEYAVPSGYYALNTSNLNTYG